MTNWQRLVFAVRELDLRNQEELRLAMRRTDTLHELNTSTRLLGRAEAYLEVLKVLNKLEILGEDHG